MAKTNRMCRHQKAYPASVDAGLCVLMDALSFYHRVARVRLVWPYGPTLDSATKIACGVV
jgi:hypothetical protein